MSLYRQIAATATIFGVLTFAAQASDAIHSTISPTTLQRILGPQLALGEQGGDAVLEGELDGVYFSVFFYGCDDGEFDGFAKGDSECLSFEYRAYYQDYPDDGETLAAFNAAHHFGALWRDMNADDALALHMPVIVEGGVADENLRASLRWWRETMRAFDLFMEKR